MASHYQYTYFRLSKTEDLLASAHRYKELRLRALKLSPLSFASTFETEATFTDDYWILRLKQDGRETFICAARLPLESNRSNGDGLEWVAQVTFLGPRSIEDFTLPAASGQPNPDSDDEEERWQLLGLFTLASHRGKGIAKNLCRKALDYLVSYQLQPSNVRVRLIVNDEMRGNLDFYRQLGFLEVGRCTQTEALAANGDFLPEGVEGQEGYNTRSYHIMMQRFLRNDKQDTEGFTSPVLARLEKAAC